MVPRFMDQGTHTMRVPKNAGFQVKLEGFKRTRLPRLTPSTKVPDLQRVGGSGIPGLQGCEILRLRGSRNPRFPISEFQWFENPKISEFRDYRFPSFARFQGCNVTGQSSELAPRSHSFQGFRLNLRLKGSKILVFQGSRVPGSIAPGFSGFLYSDLPTFETTPHIKQRKMQTNTRLRMARERRGAESSVVSMERLYYKTIH